MSENIKYFVRVDGTIKACYGFSNRKAASKFQKNMNWLLDDIHGAKGLTDFGTLTDGFLTYAYNKEVYGDIIILD